MHLTLNKDKLILASGSKRRHELLAYLDIEFDIVVPDIDEVFNHDLTIEDAVVDLAHQKAIKVQSEYQDRQILACDTVVEVDREILGKPRDKADAVSMLRKLSGKEHRVITACAFIQSDKSITFHETTKVTFDTITEEEIIDYVDNEVPFDKAGAYAIQGKAAKFIKKIEGDYYTVMGLPLNQIYRKCIKGIAD